jgi:hypothetical protein
MEDNFSPQQSLQLIESMIKKVRSDIGHNRIYFLLWGWLTFIGITGQFLLKVVFHYPHHYLIWLISFIGIPLSIRQSLKTNRRERVKTYLNEAMGSLWTGMAVSFLVLSFIITFVQLEQSGWMYCYPFFILLYGLGTFVSGKILQFRPLVIGGVINWALACAAVFFSFDYQLLFAAAAILTSYIIPGHLIGTEKNENHGA